MTRDVIVRISGDHMVAQPDDMEETVSLSASQTDEMDQLGLMTRASYYEKNGKHYILYDEFVGPHDQVIKNKIKLGADGTMEIFKSGLTQTHMVFEKGKKNMTLYRTPFGDMVLGVDTRQLDIHHEDDVIETFVEYDLEVNEQPTSVCTIRVKIESAQPESTSV